jgi:electron transfer flavoprotein alpha subunit
VTGTAARVSRDGVVDAAGQAVAIVVARDGRLPIGAIAAAWEAGGTAIVVGSGAEAGARALLGARLVRWAETGPGLPAARLAATLAGAVEPVPLVVLPSSPDGRDLAPRLAASLGRPLVAGAIEARCCAEDDGQPTVRATVSRLDDRVLVPVDVAGPAVVTLLPPSSPGAPSGPVPSVEPLPLGWAHEAGDTTVAGPDPETVAVLEPDVRTMDLADATRVVAGGAGLAAGTDDRGATARFELLEQVAAAIGASTGATRVATDAGWTGYERQVGTTGVTIHPDLYVAFGVSGATQHVGGIDSPRHVISVNTDGSCPMTAMAELGLVTDAPALLLELASRFGVAGAGPARPIGMVVDDG